MWGEPPQQREAPRHPQERKEDGLLWLDGRRLEQGGAAPCLISCTRDLRHAGGPRHHSLHPSRRDRNKPRFRIGDSPVRCPSPRRRLQTGRGWGIMDLILCFASLPLITLTEQRYYCTPPPCRGVACGGEAAGDQGRACGQREPGEAMTVSRGEHPLMGATGRGPLTGFGLGPGKSAKGESDPGDLTRGRGLLGGIIAGAQERRSAGAQERRSAGAQEGPLLAAGLPVLV